jgi:hypothetical protein
MNSTLLQGQVRKSSNRLIAALAEERQAYDLGADNPEDATILGRWRTARNKVLREADYYATALANYLEAMASALAHGTPAGRQWPTLPAESRKPELPEDAAGNHRSGSNIGSRRTVRRCKKRRSIDLLRRRQGQRPGSVCVAADIPQVKLPHIATIAIQEITVCPGAGRPSTSSSARKPPRAPRQT